ncbi:hypothetical protein Bca4012_026620 [Brassica carinata]
MKYFPNQDERREVNVEYSNFSLCMEDFGSVDVIHDRFILEPLRWGVVHGSSAPKLQTLAFKLLGQPSSSSVLRKELEYIQVHSFCNKKQDCPSSMLDVGGDQFDLLDEINLGRLEFEDLSLDEPELEAVLFGGDGENEINDEFDI